MIHFLQGNAHKVSVMLCDYFLVFIHIHTEARHFKTEETYKRHPL